MGRESRNSVEEVCELSQALGNVTVVKKGPHDVIARADKSQLCLYQRFHIFLRSLLCCYIVVRYVQNKNQIIIDRCF